MKLIKNSIILRIWSVVCCRNLISGVDYFDAQILKMYVLITASALINVDEIFKIP